MKQFLLAVCSTLLLLPMLTAQPVAKKVKPGIHWVKITWYKPLPGSQQPDKSKVPDIYLHPNQLIEYNKDGDLMSAMDYQRGSDENSGPTLHYYWENKKLKKEVQENDKYEALYTVTHSYDALGFQTKEETKSGPADKFHITSNEYTEYTWEAGMLSKETRRDEKGALQSEVTYTYDIKGRKAKEVYYPVGLYAAKTFSYDNKGNLITESYLDKNGKISSEWVREFNADGKEIKVTLSSYYNGTKQSTETTVKTYDQHGECTQQTITRDGAAATTYAWKYTYDEKGSIIQAVHLKNSTVEYVEVRKITYY
ncbi:hypothetical protein [Ferruginibacter sp.]